MAAGLAQIIGLLLRGIACGLIIAAPVGPVNVICVQRTITRSWRAGLISGLGSAAADLIYGAIAAFSVSIVIGFLVREEFWIRLFGGILLIGIAGWYLSTKPRPMQAEEKQSSHSDFVSTFLLTLTNPTTVLSYMAVLAVLRLAEPRNGFLTLLVVMGIFVGAMLWWLTLTGMVNRIRDKFTDKTLLWVHRVGGLAIGLFGIVTLVLSHRAPR
jgi:threonine/homoserine/homoserine lactone efflux protein